MAFGLRFSPLTRPEIVNLLATDFVTAGGGARVLCTANLDHIVQLRRDERLRAAYGNAWCITADGMPVYAYTRLKREAVPSRVTGSDIVSDLLAALPSSGARCFFVASCQETAQGLRRVMRARNFSEDALVFVVPPFGFEKDEAWSDRLATHIREHRSTHVFFGVGAPKSEIWTDRHRAGLGDCYVLNAGAGLDYACGVRRRAPVWMQKAGLEWAWRFGSEPSRLFKRYFIDSWGFLSAIWVDLRA